MTRAAQENRTHGLQSHFKFDFDRLARMASGAIARMTATISALDLPFREAIDFLRQKTKTPTKSHRDVWDAAHAKMFMVAGAATEAIVSDFQEAIAKALESGTTLNAFRRDFDAIVKTHGWSYRGERGWRTRTIFETSLRSAYAAGRYAQMTRPEVLEHFPHWRYNHSGALHPRLQHKAWDGTCLAHDDPFWKTAYPPNGYGCGCFVTPLSRTGLKRLGKAGPDTAPELDQLGTGQPLGVDPSFAYNPGEAWLRQTAPGPKPVAASEAIVAAFVRSALRGKWPDGSWTPVTVAEGDTARKLGVASGTEVRLSADTIRQHVHHPEADDGAYAVLPRWLKKHGRVMVDSNGRIAFVGEWEGQPYHAALKVVRKKTHEEIYLVSLRRTNWEKVRRQMKEAK